MSKNKLGALGVDNRIYDSVVANEDIMVTMREVYEAFSTLQGKILTVIDASIADREQKKAIKDVFWMVQSNVLDNLSMRAEFPNGWTPVPNKEDIVK